MKSRKVILILVLAMVLALVFAACQTNETVTGGNNDQSGEINSGDNGETGGETGNGNETDDETGGETGDETDDETGGETDTEEPTPEEPETVEVDYGQYMQTVLTTLEREEGLVCDDISTWSTERQDAIKEYLDTNYGEQFMTGDTVLDRMSDKSVVGYDFDFDNNTLTALVQATSTQNKINYMQRSIQIDSLSNFIKEYLTNEDIKEKCGNLTNIYEDEKGNTVVFVNNGEKIDLFTKANLEGKFKNSQIFESININQDREIVYSPNEYNNVINQFNWLFKPEGLQLKEIFSATKITSRSTTTYLGEIGYIHSSTGLGLDENGKLVHFKFAVETKLSTNSFLEITPDSVYAKLVNNSYFKVFGSGNTIVRVVCLESESVGES